MATTLRDVMAFILTANAAQLLAIRAVLEGTESELNSLAVNAVESNASVQAHAEPPPAPAKREGEVGIWEVISQSRQLLGWTQKRLAEEVGVSPATIINAESSSKYSKVSETTLDSIKETLLKEIEVKGAGK